MQYVIFLRSYVQKRIKNDSKILDSKKRTDKFNPIKKKKKKTIYGGDKDIGYYDGKFDFFNDR